jgi:hypothetical protein
MDRCRPWGRPAGRSEAMNVVAGLALVPLALLAVMGLSWLENHLLPRPAQPGVSRLGSRRTCRTAGRVLAPGGGFAPGGQQPRARRLPLAATGEKHLSCPLSPPLSDPRSASCPMTVRRRSPAAANRPLPLWAASGRG